MIPVLAAVGVLAVLLALGLRLLLRSPRPSFYDRTPAPELRGDERPPAEDAGWATLRLTPPAEVPVIRVLDERDRSSELALPLVLGEGGLRRVVLDFGLNLAGRLDLGLENPTPHSRVRTVTVGLGESLSLLGPRGDPLSALPFGRFHPARLALRSGQATVRSGFYSAFRYALVSAEGKPVRLSTAQARVELPLKVPHGQAYPGNWRSSDPLLTRIWYAGAYTLEMCTLAEPRVLLDGAKRDRMVWTGDLFVADRVAYVANGDTDAVRNSLAFLAGNQRRDGYVPAALSPTPGRPNLLGTAVRFLTFSEYVAWWAICLSDYYWHTGDEAFARAMFPVLVRALGWLERQARRPDGLIRLTRRTGYNWHPPDITTGAVTDVNCLTVAALDGALDLARRLGYEAPDARWAGWRDRLTEGINRVLWDETRGAYVLSDTDPVIVQDANGSAVFCGVASPGQGRRAMAYLAANLRCPYGPVTAERATASMLSYVSPYATFRELLARMSLKDAAGVLDLIRSTWGPMVKADPASTLWEKVSPQGGPEPYPNAPASVTSLAHAWAAGPTYALSSLALGVRPLAPGYARAAVEPLPGDLTWAEGTVPTPLGGLSVRWQCFAGGECLLEVRVPAGMAVDVCFPVATTALLAADGAPAHPDGLREGQPCFRALGHGVYRWQTPGAPAEFSIPPTAPAQGAGAY